MCGKFVDPAEGPGIIWKFPGVAESVRGVFREVRGNLAEPPEVSGICGKFLGRVRKVRGKRAKTAREVRGKWAGSARGRSGIGREVIGVFGWVGDIRDLFGKFSESARGVCGKFAGILQGFRKARGGFPESSDWAEIVGDFAGISRGAR